MKTISYEEWVKQYRPIQNPFNKDGTYNNTAFETYGNEIGYITSGEFKQNCIWTLIISDNEEFWIIPGLKYVDRFLYFVTEVPWEDENIQVDNNETISVGKAKYSCLEFIENVLGIELTLEQEDMLHDFWSQIK